MDTGISAGELELSKTATLTTIARASTISSAPNVTIGNKCSIKWTPASASFRYKIKFSMGNWSYLTGAIHPNQTSDYTYSGYTIPLSCADQYASGWSSGTMTATLYTYSDSECTKNVGSSSSKNFTASLPGASTITSAPDTILGNNLTVKFTPNNSSYRYKVKLTISGTNYSYPINDADGVIAPGNTAEYTHSIKLGIADIAPYVKTKTGTMAVTLTTYRDSNCTKLVGSANKKELKITVPDSSTTRPTVDMTLTAVNSGLSPTFDGLYIQDKSRVKADLPSENDEAKYKATVKSSVMTVDGKNYSSPWQSDILHTAGEKTITGTVTDSRNHVGTDEETITVIPYSVPLLKPVDGKVKIVCERCDGAGKLSASGQKLWVEMRMAYSPVIANGVQKNFCRIQYRWKTTDASEDQFNDWQTLGTTSTDTVQKIVPNISLETKKSYDVEFRAVDDITSEPQVIYFNIPTDNITFHLGKGGKRVAVGKWSEPKYDENDREIPHFEVPEGWTTYLRGPVCGNVIGLGKLENIVNPGEDFNQITGFGVYSITTDTIASQILNIPIAKAGKLIVSSAVGNGKNDETYSYLLQEYVTYDGSFQCYRSVYTTNTEVWNHGPWQYRGTTEWKDLGISPGVEVAPTSAGRTPLSCAYRVVNQNHVYIAFNCKFSYNGSSVMVNQYALPTEYRPAKPIYTLCAVDGKYMARVQVNTSGVIYIDFVQNLLSTTETTGRLSNWIDGYIDYWI